MRGSPGEVHAVLRLVTSETNRGDAPAPVMSARSLGVALCGLLLVLVLVGGCSDSLTEPLVDEPDTASETRVILASVAPPTVGCVDDVLPSSALSRICFPPDWNGDVVLWAHGYVSPFDDVALPDDEIDGQSIEAIVLGLRFAYATTSYNRNGLVAVDAVTDLVQLSQAVRAMAPVRFTYLVGASEGGLAAALASERAAAHFDGSLIACAPVGSFRAQINYFGDVRVLFDYFFPGVLPGSPISIPAAVPPAWDGVFEPAIRLALAGNPSATAQLIRAGGIAVDPADPASAIESIVDALWYNVFATNDARLQLGGGNPYDNRLKWYTGTSRDFLLNLRIARFRADASALSALQPYEASGALRLPSQMIHTRYDPVIPFWQAQLYQTEALFRSGLQLLSVPSDNYGHCAFETEEVLASFAVLVLRVTLRNLIAPETVFPDARSAAKFLTLAEAGGARPEIWSAARIRDAVTRVDSR